MRLSRFEYNEFPGTDEEWALEETQFGEVNLLVGKNATGKTRLLNAIGGLSRLLSGNQSVLFDSANYRVTFIDEAVKFSYALSIEKKKVTFEELRRGSELLFERDKAGAGQIYAAAEQRMIKLKAPPDSILANSRRDAVQHPFLDSIAAWAASARSFGFGTLLGKGFAIGLPVTLDSEQLQSSEETDTNKLPSLYLRAFDRFGEEFDKAVLRDLNDIGYACEEVGADEIQSRAYAGPPILMVYVKEADLAARTFQLTMSQGMFRALSLVIHLNYYLFTRVSRTVLIDDVGEGLDFSRASAFISLLVARAKESGLQLLMTTNDRFVMNAVPLEHWGVMSRKGGKVRVINEGTSPDVFRRFEALGLSNFDFFSMDLFEGVVSQSSQ